MLFPTLPILEPERDRSAELEEEDSYHEGDDDQEDVLGKHNTSKSRKQARNIIIIWNFPGVGGGGGGCTPPENE